MTIDVYDEQKGGGCHGQIERSDRRVSWYTYHRTDSTKGDITMTFSEILAELYADDDLMARFKENPAAVLAEKGVTVPKDVELKVIEDTAQIQHIVLPYLDEGESVSGQELEARLSKSGWSL